MDGEVLVLLQRFQRCEVLPQHAVNVRLTRPELDELRLQVGHDDLNNLVQVGQAVPVGVLEPIARIPLQHHTLVRRIQADGEGTRAYDLRRVGRDVPRRGKGTVVHVLFEDVLRIYRRAHGAQERRERHREFTEDRVVVQRRDGHLPLRPLSALHVPERERRTAARRDIVVIDNLVEREVHVVRREWLPVVPLHVPPKAERPRQTVLRMLPRLRQGGLHLVRQPRGLG